MADDPRLDQLIQAGRVLTMVEHTCRAIGVRGAEIVATSAEPNGLDHLAGPATVVVDARDLTVMPAFDDAHEHLMEASRNTLLVPVEQARSIGEFTDLVHTAASVAGAGSWVVTSMAWHESNLAENRLPSRAELDAAAPDNPVLARRGGHLAVVNSAALRAAGIGPGTPDPGGGMIGQMADGQPSGVLEGAAVYQVAAFAPSPGQAELVEGLARGSAAYAALGVGTIREAMISPQELASYRAARDQNKLRVRARPMIRVGNELSAEQAVAFVDGLEDPNAFGDDWLRVWGLKFVLDGGVEGGALEAPYVDDPSQSGHLNWTPEVLTEVCIEAARRGWRIATHAAGDRAVRIILDVYEAVLAKVGELPRCTLVIEHALLSSPEQRQRAVRAGIGITVQHSLLWNMGSEMTQTWGPERTRDVNPLDWWLGLGAQLAAGTDMARPFNPMTNVWGMATRATKTAGIQGPEHTIAVSTALELYTMGSARLNREENRRGSVEVGKLADLVAYAIDPLTADVSALADLTPAFTRVGGRPTYDPDARLGPRPEGGDAPHG
jgi:predicted amidohydrolase YtcJ